MNVSGHILTLIPWAQLLSHKSRGLSDCHPGFLRLLSHVWLGGKDDRLASEGSIMENQPYSLLSYSAWLSQARRVEMDKALKDLSFSYWMTPKGGHV